jgi:hypothetical protein
MTWGRITFGNTDESGHALESGRYFLEGDLDYVEVPLADVAFAVPGLARSLRVHRHPTTIADWPYQSLPIN